MSTQANLSIVVALHCEAKPLIEKYKLKKITKSNLPFPIFVNFNGSIHLIVSGLGKNKSAIATTYLHCFSENEWNTFLNLGIAGSSCLELGSCVLANKITDYSTQRSWYPYTSLLKHTLKAPLITHECVQIDYPQLGMVDMEGSGFFQAASIFVSQEQVQVLKVISDTDQATQQLINEKKVYDLIYPRLDQIDRVVQYLQALSENERAYVEPPAKLIEFVSQWHCTHAQTLQLKELLRRWQKKILEDPLHYCSSEKKASDVIHKLTQKLNNYANCLS